MAIAGASLRFDGDAVLLQTHPRSGATALGLALLSVMRRMTSSEHDFVLDLDELFAAGTVAQRLEQIDADQRLLVVKTHLTQDEFLKQYAFLVPMVRCRVRLFRTPIDVAVSTFKYVEQFPGALSGDSVDFRSFFRDWVQARGNWSGFVNSGFASWQDYAEEALAADWPAQLRVVHLTFDEVMDSPEAAALRIISQLDPSAVQTEPQTAPSTSTAAHAAPAAFAGAVGGVPQMAFHAETSYVRSGTFGDMVGEDDLTDCLRDYLGEFGPVVNRLISDLGVPIKLV